MRHPSGAILLTLLILAGPAATHAQYVDVTTPALADTLTGYGAAWGDYDNDGDHDLYFANLGGANRLYRNDDGVLVSASAGPMGDGGAGTGVSWGDYDNDGDLDMYLSKFGPNNLYRNDGGSTFVNVSLGNPPLDDPNSGGAPAWADYDNDGDLDLYLSNFGQANVLMRNEGGGSFVDATTPLLANEDVGEGVEWCDYDNDGDLDLYLANRGQPNKLFRNEGGGVFSDATTPTLADPSKSQGVSWGDYDNDGDFDLYVGNSNQPNKLYRNDDGTFVDVTAAPLTDPDNGHGVMWLDYDNDGDVDLCVANDGQANKLYRNDGGGIFVDDSNGPFAADTYTKGLASADYDGDGDLDIYLVNIGANQLLRNDFDNGNHWLQVDLEGVISNTYGVGARVRAVTGSVSQIRQVSGGFGYLSQNMLTLHFGLGSASTVDSLFVQWPTGVTQVLTGVAADQRMTVVEDDLTGIPPLATANLYEAVPNPFNPSTRLAFEISAEAHVRLTVYDVAGRVVKVLLDSPRSAGRHELVWQGRDGQGRSVASGVYLYRLEAGTVMQTRRMVLLK